MLNTLAAVAEEAFFRRLVYGALLRAAGAAWAVTGSAVLFAVVHVTIYGTWVRNCFKSSNLLEVDSPAAATLAVQNGQADTFMFDDAFLLGVATQDPTLKLTGDKFLNIPWGIGMRKGDAVTVKWVNAALAYMKKKDEFVKIMKANAPARLVGGFLDNVPRPNNTFSYPVGKDLPSICP